MLEETAYDHWLINSDKVLAKEEMNSFLFPVPIWAQSQSRNVLLEN